MAVKIRLTRMGSNKRPFYRIVVSDARVQRDGKYIELVGTYNPLKNETTVKNEVALKWLNLGAKPSDTVRSILSKHGVMKEFAAQKQANKIQKIKTISKTKKSSTSKTESKAKPKTKKTEVTQKVTKELNE